MDEKRKILFLDDRTKRINSAVVKFSERAELTVVTNVLECLRALSRNDYDLVYLDHDLGGRDFVDPDDPTCGMEIVHYLEKTAWPPEKRKPVIFIHSSNKFAATMMMDRLKALRFRVWRVEWTYDG